MTATTTREDWTTRAALGLVMGAALTVGTWSVYTLLTHRFHTPKLVGTFGSVMFDAAALFFARLAQRYATSPDSGLIPRLAMLAMVTTSAWVNWQHALIQHWGTVGCVVLAAAPVVAELAFELNHRYIHREALRAQGRVPSALPVVGKWGWLLHPRRAYRVIDRAVLTRLDAVTDEAPQPADAQHPAAASSVAAAEAHQVMLPEYVVRALSAASTATPQLLAAPAVRDTPTEAADQAGDAPLERRDAQHQETAAAPQRLTVVQRGDAPAAADLASLSKADAVRAARDALPSTSATEIAKHLAQHGITADAPYIRTVLSRDARSKTKAQPTNGGYL